MDPYTKFLLGALVIILIVGGISTYVLIKEHYGAYKKEKAALERRSKFKVIK
jgi:hypothetical protein